MALPLIQTYQTQLEVAHKMSSWGAAKAHYLRLFHDMLKEIDEPLPLYATIILRRQLSDSFGALLSVRDKQTQLEQHTMCEEGWSG